MADGGGGAVEGVKSGGAGGDGGVNGTGEAEFLVEEGSHRADAKGDVLGLHGGEGAMVVEVVGGGEEGGDGAFAGAAEEGGVVERDVQFAGGGEGEADGAVEFGVGIEEGVVDGDGVMNGEVCAEGFPGGAWGGGLIERGEEAAGGDGERSLRGHVKVALTEGRERTMKVKMPRTRPKGTPRHMMAAMT